VRNREAIRQILPQKKKIYIYIYIYIYTRLVCNGNLERSEGAEQRNAGGYCTRRASRSCNEDSVKRVGGRDGMSGFKVRVGSSVSIGSQRPLDRFAKASSTIFFFFGGGGFILLFILQ
jgi:hypothetical protein